MLNLSPEKPSVDGQVMRALHDIFARLPSQEERQEQQARLHEIEVKLERLRQREMMSRSSGQTPPPAAASLSSIEDLARRVSPASLAEASQTGSASQALVDAHRVERAGNLLKTAQFGAQDDLKRIDGVGPKLEALLNRLGVYYFWQVAEWSPADVLRVDAQLESFRGRVERDAWVDQARRLAQEPSSAKKPRSSSGQSGMPREERF